MKTLFSITLIVIILSPVYSQVPFNQNPNWISTDISSVSTGGTFADINQDGWVDFVVANGNDMARQRLAVYYNNGNGTFPASPNWQSADIDYHGHLDAGDVNGDGFPDVAVSVYIGPTGFGSPGKIKLYMNDAGTLSSNPSWISADMFYTFSCAFGDADGDGDLDLAAAGGESYNNNSEQPRIYYNNNGILGSLPLWKGSAFQYSYDVDWADFDNDGDLDLVFAGESSPNKIFENVNGIMSTTPVWQSADASLYANSLFVNDVNGDGYLDLAVSDNNQLGGTGKFKIYMNSSGILNTIPVWTSAFSGYGSGINLADIDNDLDADLLTGGWWQPARIYLNNNSTFNVNPQYTSTSTSVVEAIVCSDVDKDMVQNVQELFISNGERKLFYMPRNPLIELTRVVVGFDTLQKNEYCYDLENGWISLAVQPSAGVTISIEAVVSWDLDMGITNWDNNKGNYIFHNTTPQTTFPLSVNVEGGWNMVSIPGLHPQNQNVITWWSGKDPNANVFKFKGAVYQPISVAAPGNGYWMKHNGANLYNTGDEWPAEGIKTYPHNSIRCEQGWNLIGGYEQSFYSTSLTTTPPGLISGSVYKYLNGYVAVELIEPGYGYWIKLTGPGSINIPSGIGKPSNDLSALPDDFGKIIITDNTLKSFTLFAVPEGREIDLNHYELPPLPPSGIFDIRFSSHRYVERLSGVPQLIDMMGIQYPINIKAEGVGIMLLDEAGKEITKLNTGEEVIISSAVTKLMVSEQTTPVVFALEQNYPNPFNPETNINYSIPTASKVSIIIYDILGNEIERLINEEKPAGIYKLTWDAGNLPSGVYFYKLQSKDLVQTKKMMLLK